MRRHVLPAMQSLFANFDPQRYGHPDAIHCQTCHGKPRDSRAPFDSPSLLYPLDPQKIPTEEDPDPHIAKTVAFMKHQVMPAMQRFLGREVSCFDCHARTPAKFSKYRAVVPLDAAFPHKTQSAQDGLSACPPNHVPHDGRCARFCRNGECPTGFRCVQIARQQICLQA